MKDTGQCPICDRPRDDRDHLLDCASVDPERVDAVLEPDPVLEQIERHDEWAMREAKDVWGES